MSTWVIMDESKQCIVRGKAEKCLMGLEEPTRKETVTYKTQRAAQNAIRSSVIYFSEYAQKLCGGDRHRLHPVEWQIEEDME